MKDVWQQAYSNVVDVHAMTPFQWAGFWSISQDSAAQL